MTRVNDMLIKKKKYREKIFKTTPVQVYHLSRESKNQRNKIDASSSTWIIVIVNRQRRWLTNQRNHRPEASVAHQYSSDAIA